MHLQWLSNLRVLDLSQYLPGPFATRLLADMGADVVKVEPPGGEPGRHFDLDCNPGVSPFWRVLNSGKTVITLDLKSEAGREILSALIGRADVLLESYRPGVLDRLGFGNEALRRLNPGLVHCALSGYGQTGPARYASGHDINYQAITGGLNQSGTPERPVIPFPPMADYAGALQAVLTVLGALLGRGRNGGGCFIDVSMAESLLLWNAISFNAPMRRGEGLLNGGAAFYQIYATADGRFVTLSPLEPKFWDNFCNAVGRPEWIPRRYEPLAANGADRRRFGAVRLPYYDRVGRHPRFRRLLLPERARSLRSARASAGAGARYDRAAGALHRRALSGVGRWRGARLAESAGGSAGRGGACEMGCCLTPVRGLASQRCFREVVAGRRRAGSFADDPGAARAAERRRDGRVAGQHQRAYVRYSLALADALQGDLAAAAATIEQHLAATVRQQQHA